MKYFIDTEFIEGFHKPLFGKRRHFIDLISIGIVCEDGREYYAISSEFNPKDADEWVRDNVIHPIEINLYQQLSPVEKDRHYSNRGKSAFKYLLDRFGKSNKQISEEVFQFCSQDTLSLEKAKHYDVKYEKNEFYAYYADYDWVVFCSLFGRMIDLPNGFPMYCKDLKQMLDDFVTEKWLPDSKSYMQGTGVDITFDLALEKLKGLDEYPKQENEHSALDDAIWNMKLYNFLKK